VNSQPRKRHGLREGKTCVVPRRQDLHGARLLLRPLATRFQKSQVTPVKQDCEKGSLLQLFDRVDGSIE
jgi:hypothetical protein